MAGKEHLYFIIHKPYGVLSQFTDEDGNPGLGTLFKLPKDVYPVGRLDTDSEGLLILTNDKSLNARLLHPKYQHQRTYWVEVEGTVQHKALEDLAKGPTIRIKGKEHRSLPVEAKIVVASDKLAERNPPVNHKKYTETTWLELKLTEGKNRQVRRMTAAVGHPTLRLVRVAIEELGLFPLKSGEISQVSAGVLMRKLHLG
ncbi:MULTISPECIES: pseudouridine synthase [unclassified Imperialibacter]|uniref:pseudouridine synthase n=1 Tax=unclassified Imperialibacter TaxID=2629706 RepID=UPI00125947C2|nr:MULTISPECIES: pseudouridine synthase [unclassified Imperialibacter]CAD5254303.1 Pseudouridine synthase [Imperialibacter sp. 75]CAD5262742.1 Pseudouridine synthase [Imperialibacter sp. 89]VVT35303.1 Pseudouridine synthase [Imperialibacter sp. EC-SDR9]